MKKDAQTDFAKATDALLLQKLTEPMRDQWLNLQSQIEQVNAAGGNIHDHADLMRDMDEIMTSDEFILASTAAANEVMAEQGMDLQWWIDTAPKP